MVEYLELGSAPEFEKNTEEQSEMRAECNQYIELLKVRFPDLDRLSYRIVWENHDSGSYATVGAYYDDEDDIAVEQVGFIEGRLPGYWDDEHIYLFQ